MLPETEVLPSRPSSVPPPLRSVTLSVQAEQKGAVGGKAENGTLVGSNLTHTRTSLLPPKPAITIIEESTYSFDSEKRALGELNCLRTNADARQAFYADLTRTVQRVRAGEKDAVAGEKKLATCPQ